MKISIKQYSQTLFDLTDGKSEQDVLVVIAKFAEQLQKDGQLKNAGKIMEKFSDLYNDANGIVSAEIVVSKKSENLDTKEIVEFIKKKYNAKEVEFKVVVDEKIQGGIIIRVNDEIMDGSIQKQLIKLKKVLAGK
jgi:F-type H+-transporting ATPase subunit delta